MQSNGRVGAQRWLDQFEEENALEVTPWRPYHASRALDDVTGFPARSNARRLRRSGRQRPALAHMLMAMRRASSFVSIFACRDSASLSREWGAERFRCYRKEPYSWFSTHSDGEMTSTRIASLVHHTCSASQ
jgi:hypothetical protein